MERLTFVKCPKYWNTGRHPTKYSSRKTFQEVVDRLAYYEDMEEQGRLVVLPCKVGDTLFFVMNGEIYSGVVRGMYWKHSKVFGVYSSVRADTTPNETLGASFDDIGKTVFLTREEAEAALLRGGNNAK